MTHLLKSLGLWRWVVCYNGLFTPHCVWRKCWTHPTFSRHGNAQASLTLLIWLNEKVQKLRTKINQKFIGVHRTAHFLFWSVLRAEIFQNRFKIKQNRRWHVGEAATGLRDGVGLRARNLSKSIHNLTESVCTPSAYLCIGTLRVEIKQN